MNTLPLLRAAKKPLPYGRDIGGSESVHRSSLLTPHSHAIGVPVVL